MFHSLIGLLGSSESRLHPAIKPGLNTPLCMSDFGVFYLLTIILSAFAGGHESCLALSSDRDLKPLHPIEFGYLAACCVPRTVGNSDSVTSRGALPPRAGFATLPLPAGL